jgi:DNA mismatch repair protein MSH4
MHIIFKNQVVAGSIDADVVAKYVVLAGCFCLLRYVENIVGSSFSEHSIRLISGTENVGSRMVIDRRTALNLELISNTQSGKQRDSVFGVINFTRTVVGARFLRSTLLRPLNSVAAINLRLDMVEQLIRNRMGFNDVVDILVKFPDLDRMLTGMSMTEKNLTPKTVRKGIDTLIYLKSSLILAPALVSALDRVEHDTAAPLEEEINRANESLLASMRHSMGNAIYEEILGNVCNLISDSTTYSKNSHEMRHQECFAIRSGVNSFLDLARSTFLQCVEDIYELAQSYSGQLTADVRVSHSVSRGYFLLVSSEAADLPSLFIQAVQNRRTISCTTEALMSLSSRAEEAIGTALRLTNELIQVYATYISHG